MSQTSYSVIESAFPEDIITSGDYESAENLLTKKSIPSEILAESFYRLGNRFYSSEQKQAAELAWKKSRELTDITQNSPRSWFRFPAIRKNIICKQLGQLYF